MISDVSEIELSALEPGETCRTVPETVEIINQQIHLACGGVACRVSDLQTETGIKDRTAQYWIDRALGRSSELMQQRFHEPETQDPRLQQKLKPEERKQIKEMIHSEISAEVTHWVIEQPPERYNKLPQDSRKSFILSVLRISPVPSFGTALRNELRPGDHYNVLLGFPGMFILFFDLWLS